MAWLTGYTYRKQITLNGSTAGAQTNYQLKLTVYKGTGTDSAGVVYLNNHCQDDFDDIRFTKSDGSTELDHWRESYVSATSAIFWIEFDSIPISPNTANFYIYYNKVDATSASNGEITFEFFDNFPGTDLNLNKWNGETQYASVSGGIMTYNSAQDAWEWMHSAEGGVDKRFLKPHAIRSRAKFLVGTSTTAAEFGFGYTMDDSPTTSKRDDVGLYDGGGYYRRIRTAKENVWTNIDDQPQFVRGEFALWDILWITDNARFICNGSECQNSPITTTVPIASIPIRVMSKNLDIFIDWILARNYCSPEPTWGAWGSEESNQPPNAPTSLLCEGATNPTNVTDLTPEFSAIYNDPDTGDIANKYRVEVNTASNFTGTVMWDSGAAGTTMTNCTQGNRCQDISYAGTALSLNGATYYWRIRFWDDDGAEGAVSTESASFTMKQGVLEITSPSSATLTGKTVSTVAQT